jgi:hypothetical protein
VNYRELYSKLTTQLRERLPTATVAQVRNQALVTQALAYSPNCHLATLATLLPVPGQRENLVQRIRRWLANQAVTQQRCYMPLVRQLFAQWCGAEVGLVMDRTDIEDQRSILMLAIGFRHRVLPLAWRVLPFGGRTLRHRSLCSNRCSLTFPTPSRCASLCTVIASSGPLKCNAIVKPTTGIGS